MPSRVSGLDGLRALAALGVLVLHVSMYTPAKAVPPWSLVDGLVSGLHLGVTLFFVLSGFLLFRPWAAGRAPDTGPFLAKRLVRIFPAYYLALLGAWVLLAGTGTDRLPPLSHLPSLLTLQQDLLPGPVGPIPPAWTLGIELLFYLVVPAIGCAVLRWWRPPPAQFAFCATVFAASVAVNLAAANTGVPSKLHATLIGHGYAFAAGMGAAVIATRWQPGRRGRAWLVAGGSGLVALNMALHVPLGWSGMTAIRDSIAALGFAAIVSAAAVSPGRILGCAPLRWLGERSFGLYLWHFPVILAFAVRGALPGSFLGALAVVLPVSILFAHVSWIAVERPALAVLRRQRPDRHGPAVGRRVRQLS